MKKNKTFFVIYAGVACGIEAPAEWCKYFKKLYEQSETIKYTDTRPRFKNIASLVIRETTANHTELKLIALPGLHKYEVIASSAPILLFPAVHQFISRILNIMFHLSGGFVLHASSIHTEKKVFLFAGESGRGKSTIVDFIHLHKPESYILSDNSAFIRKIQNTFVVYPSPYLEANRLAMLQSHLPDGSPYPISAVYFPYHALHNNIVKLPFREKIQLIQKNSHIPYQSKILLTASQTSLFGKTIFDFIRTVNIRKLEFVKNNSFIYHILYP